MGRYELLFRIAAGGMAEVYAARVLGEAGFQKLVAVKRMLPTLADDPEFVAMFLDEARVAANIGSPNVVQTLDLGRDEEGALFIVMELVVGVPLSRVMREAAKVRRAVPVAMAVELVAQAATGLHAAHEAATPLGEPLHIVHRDVSPQNILVGIDGRARITDFGVARAVMRMSHTRAGQVKGKFAYCAPEQLRSEGVDRRADIFALGVVAWEVMAAQRLFVADHPMATMERVTSMPIPSLHGIRPKVPEAVSAVVDRMLERDPDARPPTAAEVAQALRNAARDAGLVLPSAGEVSRFVKAAGGPALAKMRRNIEATLSRGGLLADSEEFRLVEEASGVAPSTGSDTQDTGLGQSEPSLPEPDTSGVSRTPGSLLPPAPDPSTPTGGVRAWAWALIGGLVVFVVGLGVVAALRRDRVAEPLPNRPATLSGAPMPVEDPSEGPGGARGAGGSAVLSDEEPEAAEGQGHAAPGLDGTGRRRGTAGMGASLVRGRGATGTAAAMTTTAATTAAMRTGAATRTTAAMPVAMRTTAMADAMRATAATTAAMEPGETPPRTGTLVGLDAFDRELE